MSNKMTMLAGPMKIVEASQTEEGVPQSPRLEIDAYNGGTMRVGGYGAIVIDLASLRGSETIAILADHDASVRGVIGHGTVSSDGRTVKVSGVASGVGDLRDLVVEAGRSGFPWQASVGVRDFRLSHVKRGESRAVNGQVVEGPVSVVEDGEIYEVSVLPFGADGSTKATIVGGDPTEETMEEEREAPVDAERERRAGADAERERVSGIIKVCAKLAEYGEKVEALQAKAIEDSWSLEKVTAGLVDIVADERAKKPVEAPSIVVPNTDLTAGAIECAMASSAGVREDRLVKDYGEQTMDRAGRLGLRNIGIQGAIECALELDGIRPPREFGWGGGARIRAAASSVSLPGILGNVLNKLLLQSYADWPGIAMDICASRATSDYKAVYSYRPDSNMEFKEVGDDGELPSGTMTEHGYSNQASLWGKYFQIGEKTIVNDDLGVFSQVAVQLGRGARVCLEKQVFTTLLANGNVTDKTKNNQGVPASSTAAFFSSTWANQQTGSAYALGLTTWYAGVAKARELMRAQKDAYGEPILLSPFAMLVPPELEVVAERALSSATLEAYAGANVERTDIPNVNPFFNKYRLLVSPYLSLSSISGYSATAWYLMASPAVIEGIQLVWLNNVRVPTIESVSVRSETLGVAWRAKMSFGVALQDPRAMVKMTGAD